MFNDLCEYIKKVKNADYLQDADNVYRTKHYIVSQKIKISMNKDGDTFSISIDNYYPRTRSRDIDYEYIFRNRKHINGKRLRSNTYLRTYNK